MIFLYAPLLHAIHFAQAEGATIVWEALKQGGPASVALVLFVVWWIERRDHKQERQANRDLQTKLVELTQAVTEHMVRSESALKSVNESMSQIISSLL